MPIFKSLTIKHTPVKEIIPRFVFYFVFIEGINLIQDGSF